MEESKITIVIAYVLVLFSLTINLFLFGVTTIAVFDSRYHNSPQSPLCFIFLGIPSGILALTGFSVGTELSGTKRWLNRISKINMYLLLTILVETLIWICL